MGIASTVLHKPYGDAITASIGRLAVTVCVLFLAWRLDWLEASGISRWGSWQVWLLALGSLVYFACASLYSFYDRVGFDFSSLLRLPDARAAVMAHFMVNAVVAVLGLTTPVVEPGILAYRQLLWFSLPLGVLAIGLLAITSLHPVAPDT